MPDPSGNTIRAMSWETRSAGNDTTNNTKNSENHHDDANTNKESSRNTNNANPATGTITGSASGYGPAREETTTSNSTDRGRRTDAASTDNSSAAWSSTSSATSASSSSTRVSGSKRPSTSASAVESSRKRLAYAPRACDTCRKRKGKCDGCRPCEFCRNRGQECLYSLTPSDWQGIVSNAEAAASQRQRKAQPAASVTDSADMNSMSNMMMELQAKVESLTALIQQSGVQMGPTFGTATARQVPPPPVEPALMPSKAQDQSASAAAHSAVVPSKPSMQFCGPMSPDYSFHMARSKVYSQSCPQRGPPKPKLASIDDDESDSDGDTDVNDKASACSPGATRFPASCAGSSRSRASATVQPGCLDLPRWMTVQEAVRLMGVYQEVVGELHPIIDTTELVSKVKDRCGWHGSEGVSKPANRSCHISEDDNLIIVLIICIALCAEDTPMESKAAGIIYDNIAQAVTTRLASPATSLTHVVLVLTAAMLSFYRGSPRMARRLCGVAACMFMELGLHTKEVCQHILQSEREQRLAATITSTILLLDRQWSATNGLPSLVKMCMFKQDFPTSMQTSYLKAMMSFLPLSDKVSETLSRATHGQPYEDDEAFELLNFQIEQWRRRVVGQYSAVFLQEESYASSSTLPSWAVLCSLRANSVKGMLLRPFFFSSTRRPTADRSIKPALDVISNTVSTLLMLDKNSDVYRKQHPYYQHLLAGSCALLSLVIAYMAQNEETTAACPAVPEECLNTIRLTYLDAYSLACAYSGSLRASRRLLRQLVLLRAPLIRLNLLPADSRLPEASSSTSRRPSITSGPAQAWPDVSWSTSGLGSSSIQPLSGLSTNEPTSFHFDLLSPDRLLGGFPSLANMPGFGNGGEDLANMGVNNLFDLWSFPGEAEACSLAAF